MKDFLSKIADVEGVQYGLAAFLVCFGIGSCGLLSDVGKTLILVAQTRDYIARAAEREEVNRIVREGICAKCVKEFPHLVERD